MPVRTAPAAPRRPATTPATTMSDEPMNEADLHERVSSLSARLAKLEERLEAVEKTIKHDHEVLEHDHEVLEKLEHEGPPPPKRITVGL